MNPTPRRPRGRPRGFDPDAALDRAVEQFWADGFEGADVARIAHAAGVTKPSLYRLFGDKASLFLHALERYGATYGARAVAAFEAEPDLAAAVAAFLEITIRTGTADAHPTGCLLACVAVEQAERSGAVRVFYAQALAGLADRLALRFAADVYAGRLSDQVPAIARARLLADVVQGLLLRARAGVPRDALLQDARRYVPLVLG